MLRNKLSIIVYIVLLSITCVNLVACGNNDVNDENKNFVHDATKWFTEEELSTKGLAGLTAPKDYQVIYNQVIHGLTVDIRFHKFARMKIHLRRMQKSIFRI